MAYRATDGPGRQANDSMAVGWVPKEDPPHHQICNGHPAMIARRGGRYQEKASEARHE